MPEIEKLDTSSATWIAQWIVASYTSSEEYKVSQKYDGTFACSCAHWKFMKAPKHDCKHILELKAQERATVSARDLVAARRDAREAKAIERRLKGAPVVVKAPIFLKQTTRKIYLSR